MMDIKKVLLLWLIWFFHKKVLGSGINVGVNQNRQLAEKLHKPIIRKFKKRKVLSSFKDNISGDDLANIQLLIRFNKIIRFLLCMVDIFSKYAWVIHLKDKRGITFTNAFQKTLNYSKRKIKYW